MSQDTNINNNLVRIEDIGKLLENADKKAVKDFINNSLQYRIYVTYSGFLEHQEYPEDILEFVFDYISKSNNREAQEKLREALSSLMNNLLDKISKGYEKQNDIDTLRYYLILMEIFKLKDPVVFEKLLYISKAQKLKNHTTSDGYDIYTEVLKELFFYVDLVSSDEKIKGEISKLAEENLFYIPASAISFRKLWESEPSSRANRTAILINYLIKFKKSSSDEEKIKYIKQIAATVAYLFNISKAHENDKKAFLGQLKEELEENKENILSYESVIIDTLAEKLKIKYPHTESHKEDPIYSIFKNPDVVELPQNEKKPIDKTVNSGVELVSSLDWSS